MKAIYILVFLLLSSPLLYAQKSVKSDTIKPNRGNVVKQLNQIKERKEKLHDTTGNQPIKSKTVDTTIQNKYGDILHDDPQYNKKYSLWIPAVDIVGLNVLLNLTDRFILKLDFANTNFSTWKRTLQAGWPWGSGWEWDKDRFGNNFFSHPYFGAMYFNAARSNGYNYYSSFAFALGGAYMWKMFGENGTPEREDLINTSISGAFLGEILYRLSSNILDDRTRGSNRVFREIAAGLIDPVRGFNRLLQGKSFRTTNKEVYEKNPVNLSFFIGVHRVDDQSQGMFGNGTNSEMINAQFDYGNPFETRSRRPFDFFNLRVDADFGAGRKIIDNILGYGILFGKNMQLGNMSMLIGGFQYNDYWDSKLFELATIGFGGGVITKLPISNAINLYTKAHLAIVPFAGNSTQFGPDTLQFRDYNFGYGYEGKLECMLNFGKYAELSVVYYYYMIHTFNAMINDVQGLIGNNHINVLKPRITVNLYKSLNIGIEDFIYFDNRYLNNSTSFHAMRTEQKLFLLIYLEDSQRRGKYN